MYISASRHTWRGGSIRSEQNFLRRKDKVLAQYVGIVWNRAKKCYGRRIYPNVWLQPKVTCDLVPWSAPVNENHLSFEEPRISQHIFKVANIRLKRPEKWRHAEG